MEKSGECVYEHQNKEQMTPSDKTGTSEDDALDQAKQIIHSRKFRM